MTLPALIRERGKIEALKAIGQNKLADDLEIAEKYLQSVMEKDGVMPFSERPKAIREKLTSANEIRLKAYDFIFKNRKKTIDK